MPAQYSVHRSLVGVIGDQAAAKRRGVVVGVDVDADGREAHAPRVTVMVSPGMKCTCRTLRMNR